MKNGKMTRMQDGKEIGRMDRETTMSNGTKVMMNGKMMMKGGKEMQMKEGQMVMMDGKMMEGNKDVRDGEDGRSGFSESAGLTMPASWRLAEFGVGVRSAGSSGHRCCQWSSESPAHARKATMEGRSGVEHICRTLRWARNRVAGVPR